MKLVAVACLVLLGPLVALAAPDPASGRRLVKQHKCESCHQRQVAGPEGAIYLRNDRMVTSRPKLESQVAACNSMLGLGLFPDEEAHIAAYLNETYYKFPSR